MNQNGHTYQIEYQETPGVNRTARLTRTEYPYGIPGIATKDAEWQVLRQGEDTWNGDFENLTYLGTDGNIWKTKIHCHYDPRTSVIRVWMESERDNGEGNNPTFEIVDWAGKKWHVDIDAIAHADGSIGFTLTAK